LNPREYRRNAQECWTHANDAKDEETMAVFQVMAIAWEKLAAEVESLQRHRSLLDRFIVPILRLPASLRAHSDSSA
jgi:hypothetical protein